MTTTRQGIPRRLKLELAELREDFENCFENLQKLVNRSLDLMGNNPGTRDDVADLWKQYVSRFSTFTFKTSEKHNNREVFKAITKALIFGK